MSGSVSILLLALLVYSECNSWHLCRQLQWFLPSVISQTLAGLRTNGEKKSGSIKNWRKSDVQWKSNDTIFCTKRPLLDCLSFKTLYVVSFSIHTFGPCSAFWKVLSLEKINNSYRCKFFSARVLTWERTWCKLYCTMTTSLFHVDSLSATAMT